MKSRTWFTLGGIGVALVAAIAISSLALAQRPQASTASVANSAVIVPFASGNTTPAFGRGFYAGLASSPAAVPGGHGYEDTLISVAASKLGITSSALITELQSGKTIAQVAAEHKVATSTIANAFIAAETTQLNALVASGQITQAQENTMLADLKADVNTLLTQPFSFGHCPNMGGSASSQTSPSSAGSTAPSSQL